MNSPAPNKNSRRLRPSSERGQLLLMFVLFFGVVALAGAISVDVGFWLSERRGISRATDLSAIAAVQDLPESRTEALATAYDFADRNGYGLGDEGTTVEVTFYCGNSIQNPPAGICQNPLAPYLSVCHLEVGCDAIEVKIRKPARGFFTSLFGSDHVHVAYLSLANVKFNLVPIDTALVLDATSSMGVNSPLCNGSQSNNGCPIKEARDAANRFVNILLDGTSNLTQVGYVPYRGCYDPPRAWNACIRDVVTNNVANVTNLTANANLVRTEINQTTADVAGSGTNTCWALRRARTVLDATTQTGDLQQFVVLLADGNNVYNSNVLNGSASPPSNNPPGSCRPGSPTTDTDTGAGCNRTASHEADLDELTWARALDLEADGVEIYVVGFGVCGTFPSAAGQPACRGVDSNLNVCTVVSQSTCNSTIGRESNSSSDDNTADRRILKCVASSEPGTNDHYFEINDADDLPAIFQIIAFQIASRGLTEDGL